MQLTVLEKMKRLGLCGMMQEVPTGRPYRLVTLHPKMPKSKLDLIRSTLKTTSQSARMFNSIFGWLNHFPLGFLTSY